MRYIAIVSALADIVNGGVVSYDETAGLKMVSFDKLCSIQLDKDGLNKKLHTNRLPNWVKGVFGICLNPSYDSELNRKIGKSELRNDGDDKWSLTCFEGQDDTKAFATYTFPKNEEASVFPEWMKLIGRKFFKTKKKFEKDVSVERRIGLCQSVYSIRDSLNLRASQLLAEAQRIMTDVEDDGRKKTVNVGDATLTVLGSGTLIIKNDKGCETKFLNAFDFDSVDEDKIKHIADVVSGCIDPKVSGTQHYRRKTHDSSWVDAHVPEKHREAVEKALAPSPVVEHYVSQIYITAGKDHLESPKTFTCTRKSTSEGVFAMFTTDKVPGDASIEQTEKICGELDKQRGIILKEVEDKSH